MTTLPTTVDTPSPRVAGLLARLDGLAAEARDWAALEDAARALIRSAAGDGRTVILPTQRTDEVETILSRIDARRAEQHRKSGGER